MNLFFVATSAALGVGLAMDAFSVSLANGLHEPYMKRRRGLFTVQAVYSLDRPAPSSLYRWEDDPGGIGGKKDR